MSKEPPSGTSFPCVGDSSDAHRSAATTNGRRAAAAARYATTSMPTGPPRAAARGSSTVEHGLQGGDRDGELVVVGLARGQLLELQAGPHDACGPSRGGGCGPANLMISKEMPAISGTPRMRVSTQQVPGRQPDRREDEDRHDHDDQQEARAAARVQAARSAARSRGRAASPAS